MRVVIYEDYYYLNFVPFYRFHTIYDLYSGFRKIYQKVYDLFYEDNDFNGISFIGREYQLKYFFEKYEIENEVFDIYDDILFVNSRIKNIEKIRYLNENECLIDQNDEVIAFRVDKIMKHKIKIEELFNHENDEKIKNILIVKEKVESFLYSFEFITSLSEEFQNDFRRFYPVLKKRYSKIKKNVFIRDKVRISKYVELDDTNGPIIISDGTIINPFTAIYGPVFIGKNCVVDKAYIRGNTVIGNVCKVSGEIEESIISDYSNKHHTGFLGHSYLGEWVNIGAISTTSDLKNNYSNIKFEINGKIIDSGSIKMGSLFGDHVKLSIGIMVNCGTIIQEGTVVFDKIRIKNIPPFMWGDIKYNKEKFIENVKKVINRRGIVFTNNFFELIKNVFK